MPIYQSKKGTSSLGPEGLFKMQSNRTSFYFSFPRVGTEARTGIYTDIVGYYVSSLVFSYYLRYDFPDRVPVGWGAAPYVVKACSSSLESLREANVTLSSSGKTETTLQDFPFDLGLFESHCSSWARSGCTHMISTFFNVRERRPLASCCLAEGLFISSRALGRDPSGSVTFGIVLNSRVTIFAVTFFCSDFKVRTLASTKA